MKPFHKHFRREGWAGCRLCLSEDWHTQHKIQMPKDEARQGTNKTLPLGEPRTDSRCLHNNKFWTDDVKQCASADGGTAPRILFLATAMFKVLSLQHPGTQPHAPLSAVVTVWQHLFSVLNTQFTKKICWRWISSHLHLKSLLQALTNMVRYSQMSKTFISWRQNIRII